VRAVQVLFAPNPQRRSGEVLLTSWPTLPAICAAVVRAGVELSVVVAAHREEKVVRNGVTFHFVDDPRAHPIRLLGRVRVPRRPTRLIERVLSLKPQVVHGHDLGSVLAIHQLSKALGDTPLLVENHRIRVPRGWRRAVWRRLLAPVAGVAFTSRQQAEPFIDAGVLRRDVKIFEVLPASSSFSPGNREAARRETGLVGEPCFLWTTRLDANKDPFTALDAFETAAASLPAARLWIAYHRAPLLDQVRERIAASEVLRERVTLLGGRPYDQMEALFRSADFFVQTSHAEASGRSLLDAMACGVTPLVTDIPPWRRIVGSTGSLTPVGDSKQLARAMIEWAKRDRAVMGRTVRAHFEETLSYDVIGRDLAKVYASLIR
jgi:glycosyltransferase involved in cell wall biosynthesis